MYPTGRYFSSSMNPNIGAALSISDSANRDPVSSSILKASGNQQYRGKSPLPNAGSLPTHSYYTRSKSVCLHCPSIFDASPTCVLLVIFQVLEGAANARRMVRFGRLPPLNAISFSLTPVFWPSCVLFQTRELLLSHRFFLLFCSRENLCLNNDGVSFSLCFVL